jgi:type I restriction enzyme S subunit
VSTLGEFADFEMGQAPPGSECNFDQEGTVFVKAGEFGSAYPIEREWTTKPLKFGRAGDVFICVVGATAGKLNLGIDCAIGRSVAAIRPKAELDTKFLYYQLQPWVLKLRASSSGSAQGVISKKQLADLPFDCPELATQHEIVAELEKQFSRLDEAVANLQRVKANLKRYKASVLKAAVEGRLVETEASLARSEGRTYETGVQLLQRMHEERQGKWVGKGKFKPPREPGGSDLPELPEGWIWSSFEAVADRVTVGHVGSMKNEYVEKGVPFLRSQNVRPNRFDAEGLKYISEAFHASLAKSALSPGDIAVVRSGSVGVSCVIPANLPDANCSDLVIIKGPRGVDSQYGAYYLNSVVESRIAAGRVGVALVHFNTQSVAELPLPLPPIAEQRRIAAEVDRNLSIIREVESTVDSNLKRAQALRHANLAKAFAR